MYWLIYLPEFIHSLPPILAVLKVKDLSRLFGSNSLNSVLPFLGTIELLGSYPFLDKFVFSQWMCHFYKAVFFSIKRVDHRVQIFRLKPLFMGWFFHSFKIPISRQTLSQDLLLIFILLFQQSTDLYGFTWKTKRSFFCSCITEVYVPKWLEESQPTLGQSIS